jgi:tripartite-type tricarboxylate transporter receptor subunit TctC
MKHLLSALGTLLFALAAASAAHAEDSYPSRPIRLVVPYNAGGAGDAMARAISKELSPMLGQSVVVDNKPGASGMIGTGIVAKSKGDPYTLLLGSSAEISINPSLYRSVSYKTSDLQPVAFAGKLPLVLVSGGSSPLKNVAQVIDAARKRPGEITFASAGAGQTAHLAIEVVMQKTGAKLLHVPYKGGTEAVLAVIGGQADLFFSGLPPALPQIASGKLQALAVSTKERTQQLPNVPTVAESGLGEFDIYNWFAVFAPAGVPRATIDKLNAAINAALQTEGVKKIWQQQGIVGQPMAPTELGQFVEAERSKYQKLITTAHITVD